MDWQVLAVWLVAGTVVIAIIARWFLRHVFDRGGTDGNNGKGNRGDKGKPPCCG